MKELVFWEVKEPYYCLFFIGFPLGFSRESIWITWFCFSGDFLFWALPKGLVWPFGIFLGGS